jgi:hypothetical protein
MDALLLLVAWVAGIASLFLIADMITADLANRRAERLATRPVERSADREPRGRRKR